MSHTSVRVLLAVVLTVGVIVGCGGSKADLILLNGRVYTLAWGDPGPNGEPAADAPPGGCRLAALETPRS